MKKLFHRGSKRKIGKIIAFAVFFGINLGWVNGVSSGSRRSDVQRKNVVRTIPRDDILSIEDRTTDRATRAPREGGSSVPCASSGASCPELAAIRDCVCYLRSIMDQDLSCCEELQEDMDILIECCNEVREDIRETWTMIDNCCDELSRDFRETWTMIDDCCDELSRDFRETWTILDALGIADCCDVVGLKGDVLDPSITPSTILDVNITNTMTIIQWLKAIYDKVK
jgi:hypothetical protein